MKKQEIINKLKLAKRSKGEMQELADAMIGWAASDYDELLKNFIDEYDGPSIGNLLIVSALNEIKLDGETLVNSLVLLEEHSPAYYAFAYQTKEVIPVLYNRAIKFSYRAAGLALVTTNIAVEMAIKCNSNKALIAQLIEIMYYRSEESEYHDDFTEALKVLKNKEFSDTEIRWRLKREPMTELPERYHRVTFPNAGEKIIPAYKIGQADPLNLKDEDLIKNFEIASGVGLLSKAMEFFDEILRRLGIEEAIDHFNYLFYCCIIFQDYVYLQSLLSKMGVDFSELKVDLLVEIIKDPYQFEKLEEMAKIYIQSKNELSPNQFMFGINLLFNTNFPAMSVILNRAAIGSFPEDNEDLEQFIDNIKDSRIRLGLDMETDPVFEVCNWLKKKQYYLDLENEVENERSDNNIAYGKIYDLKREVKERSKTNKKLGKEVEEWKKKAIGDKEYQALKKERDELLYKVDQLKMELKNCKSLITEAKDEKKALQDSIDEQESIPAMQEDIEEDDDGMDESGLDVNLRRLPKKFVYPTFEDSYYDSVEKLDVPTKSKAWDAANGFASSREDIWKLTVGIKGAPGYYRIKFHNGYRLMIQWEQEKTLRIIEVIHRQNLETWIRNHKDKTPKN